VCFLDPQNQHALLVESHITDPKPTAVSSRTKHKERQKRALLSVFDKLVLLCGCTCELVAMVSKTEETQLSNLESQVDNGGGGAWEYLCLVRKLKVRRSEKVLKHGLSILNDPKKRSSLGPDGEFELLCWSVEMGLRGFDDWEFDFNWAWTRIGWESEIALIP
jgi:hypothetical protein